MTRTELLLSDSCRHLIQNAIEHREKGQRRGMRREAKRAIDWFRKHQTYKQETFFVEDTYRHG